MATKKPTAFDRLMNPGKQERDAWQADRNRRVELSNKAPMASVDRMTIKYNDEKFNKKKPSSAKGVTKEWERSELKGLPKSYGTSMDKKFGKWATEQGIPKQDHYQFRQWMDANESKVKSDSRSGTDTMKARNVQQANSRSANEQRKKDEIIKVQKEQEVKAAKVAKKEEKRKNNGVFNFLSGIDKGFNKKTQGSAVDRVINRTFNSMGGSSNREMMDQLIREGPNQGREEQYAEMVQQYEDRFGGKTTALDFGADIAGYLAPGAAAYKSARAIGLGAKGLTKGASLKNVGQFAKEGAAAGGILGGAEVAIREDLNPENYSAMDNLKHLGLNVAAGAALDPLIGLAGPVVRALNPNNMAEKALSDASKAQIDKALRFGEHTTLNPQRPSVGGPMPGSGLAEGVAQGQIRFPATPATGNPLAQLVTGPTAPSRLTAPQVAQKPAPDAPFESKMAYFRDKNNPITEQDLPEIHARMGELHTELEAFKQNVPQLREVEFQKNPKLKERMYALNEQAKVHVEAKNEWKAVQEIQKLYKQKQNRPEWMNITDTLSDDFVGIPKRFRSSGSVTDPYMAMEQAGFDDMEAFIGHLQTIDSQLNVKMKDVQTVSGADATKATKQLQKLESELDKHIMKNYGMVEQQKLLDELVGYSTPREGAVASVPEVAAGTEVMPQGAPMGVTAGRVNPYEGTPFAKPKGRVENFIDKHGTAKDLTARLRTEVDSSLHPVKKLEADLIKKHGDALGERLPDGTLAEKDSIAKPMQMLKYSEAKGIKSFEDGDAPRQAILKTNKIPNAVADQYNLAMHARDIYANEADKLARLGEIKTELEAVEANRIANTDPGMLKAIDDNEAKLLKEMDTLAPYELPAMATEDWTNGILKQFEGKAGIVEQQKMFVKEQSQNLAILRESGHIAGEVEEALMKKYPNYVPLNRDIVNPTGKRKGSANAKNPLTERKQGSKDLQIVNLRESAIKNRIAAVSAADRAKVFKSIDKISKVDDIDGVFQRVSPSDPNYSRFADQVIKGPDGSGGEVHYKVPAVVKEAMEYAPTESHLIVEALGKSAQLFKNLTTTYNPQFHIKALARDTPQMMAASKTHAHAGHMVMGFLDSFLGKNLEKLTGGRVKSYQADFDKLGGDYSTFISQDKDSIQRYMKAIESGKFQGMKVFNPLKHIENFGKKSEQVARLGEFRSAKGKGYSNEDAFFDSINLLDYKDQGTLTRSINKVSPYLSPTVRGNVRTLQAMKTPQFWTTGAAYVATPTILNYALKHSEYTSDVQREKMDNLPTWAKNTMWAVPVPNSENVILYPKPFILGQMFANPIERTLDKLFHDTEKPTKDIMKETGLDVFSTIVPSVTITGFTAINEMQANQKFFTGMPIEDKTMLAEPDPTERYNSYTSEVAKKAGKLTGSSPARIDAMLKGQLGTVGTKGLDLLDNVIAKGGSRPSKVSTDADILNPLGNFLYKDSSASGLYERVRKQSLKDDKEQKASAPDGRREKGYARTEAQQAMEFFNETNKEVKSIRESHELTPKEKKEQISAIREQQKHEASKILKSK